MKTKTHKKLKGLGFAHPVVLAVLLLGVLGVVGLSAQRVYNERSKAEKVSVTQPQEKILIDSQASQQAANNTAQQNKTVTLQGSGSAAEASVKQQNNSANQPNPAPTKKQISSQYDLSTPIGSLSQLALDAKQGNFENALYFITPRLMFSAYDSLSTQNITDFEAACQNNSTCNTLLTTDLEINPTHITETTCTTTSNTYSECRKLSTKFVIENGKISTVYYKTVGYHVHQMSITMLKSTNSDQWVIDSVTVDSFTL